METDLYSLVSVSIGEKELGLGREHDATHIGGVCEFVNLYLVHVIVGGEMCSNKLDVIATVITS